MLLKMNKVSNMIENIFSYLKYYIIDLGVPASPSRFPLIVLGMLRKARLPAGYPLQSLTRRRSYFFDLCEIVLSQYK